MRAICSEAYADSVMGHLIEEIKSLASANFSSFECVFTGRVCNDAAHELAKLGKMCIEGVSWLRWVICASRVRR